MRKMWNLSEGGGLMERGGSRGEMGGLGGLGREGGGLEDKEGWGEEKTNGGIRGMRREDM